MNTFRLDFILPAYNASSGWAERVVCRIGQILEARPQIDLRLIIVPDGSSKGHEAEVRKQLKDFFADRLLYVDYPTNRGKGYALRAAVRCSDAPYILYTDWDLPFTNESLLNVIDTLVQGADVVLPIRDTQAYRGVLPPMRKMLSAGSHLINRVLLSLPHTDTQAGLKGFNQKGRDAFLQTKIDRFLFDTEFIAIATKMRLEIIPTRCFVRPEIILSTMSTKTILHELGNIPDLIRARWF